MKKWLPAALALSVALTLSPALQAKRLGGGGLQRSLPSKTVPPAAPAKPAQPAQNTPPQGSQQAQPAQAAPAAAAQGAAGKRSWLGPIAGLAAGLGLAALLSHFGLGEAFANGMMMVLLLLAVVALGAWLFRRFGGRSSAGALRPAYAGAAAAGSATPTAPSPMPGMARQGFDQAAPGSAAASFASGSAAASFSEAAAEPTQHGPSLPADFDQAGFERLAKMIFIRLQAANDRADLNDLRRFTTPEMFASIRLDLQSRGTTSQQTDVERVDAEVLELVREGDRDIVSVRYHGLIREDVGTAAQPFDEVWHLVRPHDGSVDWAIAGIQTLN